MACWRGCQNCVPTSLRRACSMVTLSRTTSCCTSGGAAVIDPAPYYGHRELDLALLDYFEPVSPIVFDAYREILPLDHDFAERRELWRVFAYLAVIAVDGRSQIGNQCLRCLDAAVRRYR